jgi:hypothetical protein
MEHTSLEKIIHYYKCHSIPNDIWEHQFSVSKIPFVKEDDEDFTDIGKFVGINQSSYWVVYFFFENYVENVYAFPTKKLAYEKFKECQEILQNKSLEVDDGIDLIFLKRDGQLIYSECGYDRYSKSLISVDKTWAYIMEEVYLD